MRDRQSCPCTTLHDAPVIAGSPSRVDYRALVPNPLNAIRSKLERRVGHVVFGSRRWVRDQVADVAAATGEGRVLEIGSGRTDHGDDAYSMRPLFPETAGFVKSDLNPAFGHLVIDITTMEIHQEYDVILCLSVLEHVPEFWKALPRMQRALRPGGRLVLSVPMVFPYHDEPDDFFRFTEYGVRSMLHNFERVDLRHRGPRRLPLTVFAVAHVSA